LIGPFPHKAKYSKIHQDLKQSIYIYARLKSIRKKDNLIQLAPIEMCGGSRIHFNSLLLIVTTIVVGSVHSKDVDVHYDGHIYCRAANGKFVFPLANAEVTLMEADGFFLNFYGAMSILQKRQNWAILRQTKYAKSNFQNIKSIKMLEYFKKFELL
jgi:hypothetical protein